MRNFMLAICDWLCALYYLPLVLWHIRDLKECECCGVTIDGCYWDKRENWEHKSKCRQCGQAEIVWHGKIAPANHNAYYCKPCWSEIQDRAEAYASPIAVTLIDRNRHDALMDRFSVNSFSHDDGCWCDYCKPLEAQR